MKAVVLERPETLVYHDDVPTPEPGAGQVRVRMQAASICGSDVLRVYRGHAKVYPLILGHECAGVVDAVGEGVPGEMIGQVVGIVPLIPCMTCEFCQRGLYASCTRYSFIGSRIAGGFAEYVIAPSANVVPLLGDLEPEIGALIEPTTVALHALNRGGGADGLRVGIFGIGSIGMLTVLAARFQRAAQIVAVDVVERNLDAARSLGADVALNAAQTDVIPAIRDAAKGGVDLALEVSGSLKALEQCIQSARPGGEVVFVGNQPMDGTLPSHLVEHIMRYQLNLHGAWMSYSAPFPGREWTDAAAAIQGQRAAFKQVISHHVGLAQVAETFQQMMSKSIEHRKIIIHPS